MNTKPKRKPDTRRPMNRMVGPVGKLRVIGAVPRGRRTSQHAAWAYVLVQDKAGTTWQFQASAFSFNMERPNAELSECHPGDSDRRTVRRGLKKNQ
jgi:hypothetical protein